jgi:hypothetical protein
MVTVVSADTANVVTVNETFVDPFGTVTVAGTVATAVLEELRVTTWPPTPAALESVTLPVELVRPATVAGVSVRVLMTYG